MKLADSTALAQFAFVALSFGALAICYVISDFSVVNVYENSHSQMPLIYKMTSVWGNHEGSMLLWVLILAIFGALVAVFGTNLPASLKANVLAVQSWVASAFYLFILFTSNPFRRLAEVPVEGRDLNPILQVFWFGGASSDALSRLCRLLHCILVCRCGPDRRPHRCGWARWVRPWTLLPGCA
jgi:Cytochrome c biogenesis factor